MKKLTILFLAILVLISSFSITAEAGIQIWPGKLTITMNEWYDKWVETKYNKIQVTNPYSYGINVSVKLNNPGNQVISEGYSYIPDLSWIKVVPETIYLPPNSSNQFEVIIEVPKNEQLKYFNEKWETWVVFTSNLYSGRQGGMNFQVELAVKLFINTPVVETAGSQYLFIILFVISAISAVIIALFFIKRRRNYQIDITKPYFSIFFYRRKK